MLGHDDRWARDTFDATDLGFDAEIVRQEINLEEWQAVDEFTAARYYYLGTVFSLLPSGKYYTPWASSNVEPCSECDGTGSIPQSKFHSGLIFLNRMRPPHYLLPAERYDVAYEIVHKVRNWINRTIRKRKFAPLTIKLLIALYKIEKPLAPVTCALCNGLGSAEVARDQEWYDLAHETLAEHDLSLEHGEGDPCDLFAVEYRDYDDWDDPSAEVCDYDLFVTNDCD